jgi:hypothetical protein
LHRFSSPINFRGIFIAIHRTRLHFTLWRAYGAGKESAQASTNPFVPSSGLWGQVLGLTPSPIAPQDDVQWNTFDEIAGETGHIVNLGYKSSVTVVFALAVGYSVGYFLK